MRVPDLRVHTPALNHHQERALLPHQVDALAYCMRTENPALFMKMRLGKSKTIVEWCKAHGFKHVLIVSPKTSWIAWTRELSAEHIKDVIKVVGTSQARGNTYTNHTPGWYLSNYDSVYRTPEVLDRMWDAVILDESTRVKNPKAKCSRFIVNKLRHVARRRAVLSGMPTPESPLEIIMQLLFLDGQFMGFKDYWSFRANMCYVSRYEWIVKPTIQPKFKSYIHDRCYFLTHKSAGLNVNKVYSEHYVPMTQLQRKAFEGMAKDYQVNGKSTKWATVAAMWLSQISGGYFNGKELSKNKIRALGRLLMHEHVSHSAVVWFRFIEEIKQASAYLKMLGISYGVIHGTVDMDTRDRLVQNFQHGRIRVLLIQEKTGLFSLNLSKASTMIFYSNELSCEVRAQCEDRIVHPTKSEPLFYIDMVTEGSSDEEAVEGLKTKKLSASILCQKFGERFY